MDPGMCSGWLIRLCFGVSGYRIHQATDKRATITAPPGVPQYNFDMCSEDLAKLKTAGTSVVHTTIESNGKSPGRR